MTALRRVLRSEAALYRGLARWLTRRPDVPAGAVPAGYVREVNAVLWAFIGVSLVELVAFHLLIPWEGVRLVVDLLGVWGLVWMLGLKGSLTVRPHLVTATALRVRHGLGTDVTVPWTAVTGVRNRRRGRDSSRVVQLDDAGAEQVLNVVMGNQTNVELTLDPPLLVPLPAGEVLVREVRLFADDPAALVREARARLTERTG